MVLVKRERDDSDVLPSSSSAKRQRTDAEPQRPSLKTYSDLFADTVFIDVPEAEQFYSVHSGLLSQQSQWFADRITGADAETTLDIPVRICEIFLLWLYTGNLVPPGDNAPAGHPTNLLQGQDQPPIEWDDADLATLYCFAREHGVRHLKNDVVTTIIAQNERLNNFASDVAVRIVFEKCGAKCSLSQYLMDERARDGMDPDLVPGDLETWPPLFLAGVIRSAARKEALAKDGKELPTIKARDACAYHDHDGDREERVACRRKLSAMPEYLY